jgi:hypothetical protein
MAKDKKSVLIYVDWISIFDELSDEEAGKLVKHLFRYVNDRNPEAPDRLTKLLFEPIKQTLKRDLVNYQTTCDKNKENALIRWNKLHAVASDGIKDDAKHADSDNDSDNDSDIDNDSDKEKKKKTKYTEFVSMLEKEYDTLVLNHGEENTKILIDILSNYKGSKGIKYKSDYLTILNWVIDRAKKDGKYKEKTKFTF